jgi:hypothetical protein
MCSSLAAAWCMVDVSRARAQRSTAVFGHGQSTFPPFVANGRRPMAAASALAAVGVNLQ